MEGWDNPNKQRNKLEGLNDNSNALLKFNVQEVTAYYKQLVMDKDSTNISIAWFATGTQKHVGTTYYIAYHKFTQNDAMLHTDRVHVRYNYMYTVWKPRLFGSHTLHKSILCYLFTVLISGHMILLLAFTRPIPLVLFNYDFVTICLVW